MTARGLRAFWLAAAVTSTAACGEAPPPEIAHAPAPWRSVQAPNDVDRASMDDARIAAVLKRELGRDAVVTRERMAIGVDLGVVTLQGTVRSRLARERAVAIAHVVRGVRAIVDRLEIAAAPRPDYELEFMVAGALSHDPVTAGEPIAAWAHEGVVQLSGEADSLATRRAAQDDVLGLAGVRDVVDDVAVLPKRVSGERRVREAERVLQGDPWLDASRVEVRPRGDGLEIGGWVGSAAERARAEADAQIASPGAVDASALRIDAFVDDGTLRASPGRTPSDGDLAQALLDCFVVDPRVHPFVPTVDVHDRVVVLTGLAPSQDALRAADDDARNVPGVAAVRDDVRERPSLAAESDETVLSEVLSALAREPHLGSLPVSVQVFRGRVFLRGTVPSDADRMHVIALAASAAGARDVDDGLRVVPAHLARRASYRSP